MSIKSLTLWRLELLPWYAFLVVWMVAALWVKRPKVVEPLASRLRCGALLMAGLTLLFSHWPEIGFLKQRFVPGAQWLSLAGVGLTFAGAGLAIWARLILGENWSARVSRKAGHELIRTGPYAWVRHPIYSGLLLACLGTALVVGQWKGLLAIPLILIAQWIKARREEHFMVAEFGEAYQQYRQHTGFLLPRFKPVHVKQPSRPSG
jgi:protein-S-isoprenylcysteine O-methyltransferase Ste14